MWSKERIWEWYQAKPWIRGCNYMSADCANRIDQWQEYGFEERFQTTESELALAKSIGFNSIRIIPEFIVWQKEHDGFMERFERYVATAHKHGLSCMVVLGNDCAPPKEEALRRLQLGKQHVDWGYHGGRKVSQHGRFEGVGYHLLDEPEIAPQYYEYIREIVETYKNDERILLWDVYNEPGNSKRGERTLPHLQAFFDILRKIDPIQPLTSAIWSTPDIERLLPVEKFALENSDIVSFHSYHPYTTNVKLIHSLKKLGRPLICSEWLARCIDNNVEEMFPLFYLENIGCYNWGLVAGKYQTYEPYNASWEIYDRDKTYEFDFTKWLHDLFRQNHRPYNPKEIELIQEFCALADKEHPAP